MCSALSYVREMGRKMCSAYAYVPIAGGTRCSIGIFSYQKTMTFGINADFDAFPDVDVLSGGIRSGIEELLELARAEKGTPEVTQPKDAAPAAKKAAPAAKKAAPAAKKAAPAAKKKAAAQ